MHRTRTIGLVAFAAYVATVFAANWALTRYGIVSVGFGLYAPAGVYFAGLAFTFRDVIQETLGREAVVLGILAGAAASWAVSATFATASACAFLVSELADFAVYTPLRVRSPVAALALSNTVGAVVDSVVFLWLAFSSLALLWGQVIGKLWVTLPFVVLLAVYRWRRWELAS